jgi:protein involved in polysaccharide export with SLBB domain
MNLKRLLHSACSVLLVVAAVSCLSLRRSSDVIPLASPAVLHPGDSIKVVVWRNAELSGAFLVAADGTIRHPLYQTIQVANTPLDSVTARLGAFLSELTTTPHFVVEPKFHVVVRGEVLSPALYTVPLETTLGGAIAVAGGPTQEAQLRKVTLVRDQHSYLLDLSDPAAPWTASPIRSGDQIIIGRKSNLFFGTILPLVTAGAALASLISVLRRY